MKTEVHRFEVSRRADFFDLHSKKNGEGWCCCVASWVPTWDGWGERSARHDGARIVRANFGRAPRSFMGRAFG